MRKVTNFLLAIAILVGTATIAPPAVACARHMIANRDTCADPPCPVVICTLIGEDANYCYYTC